MVIEQALLSIRPGMASAFEAAMREAVPLIAASPGFLGLEVRPSVDAADRYLLLVRWRAAEDHDPGFRGSDRYLRWKALLHHFYEPFPHVEHFGAPVAFSMPRDLLRLELFVADVARSADFYGRVLGFAPSVRSGDYVAMQLGLVTLSLNARAALPADHAVLGEEGVAAGRQVEIVLPVEDVDAACRAVQDAGWPIRDPLVTRPWGLRDFRVEDPDGFYLRVQSAASG